MAVTSGDPSSPDAVVRTSIQRITSGEVEDLVDNDVKGSLTTMELPTDGVESSASSSECPVAKTQSTTCTTTDDDDLSSPRVQETCIEMQHTCGDVSPVMSAGSARDGLPEPIYITRAEQRAGFRLASLAGMAMMCLGQLVGAGLESNEGDNADPVWWFLLASAVLATFALCFLTFFPSGQRISLSAPAVQPLPILVYSAWAASALATSTAPSQAGMMLATCLFCITPILRRLDVCSSLFVITLAGWICTVLVRDDYPISDVVLPFRLLLCLHATQVGFVLIAKMELCPEEPSGANDFVRIRASIMNKKQVEIGVNTDALEVSVPPTARKQVPHLDSGRFFRPVRAASRRQTVSEEGGRSPLSKGTVKHMSWDASSVPSCNDFIEEAEGSFFVASYANDGSVARKDAKRNTKGRLGSIGTDIESIASSVVSFAASVKAKGGHLTYQAEADPGQQRETLDTGYHSPVSECTQNSPETCHSPSLSVKARVPDHEENANVADVDELMDAETFNKANLSKDDEGCESPQSTRRNRSGTQSKKRPSTWKRTLQSAATNDSKDGNTILAALNVQRSFHLVQVFTKAKSSLREARKEVKDLMEVDVGVPTSNLNAVSSPFEQVPPATLHKIVMLISRLSEETDVIRSNYLIVAGVCEILKCDRASVFLVEGKTVRTFDEEGREISVPMDKSLAGYAALTCRVLNIQDAYCDPRFNKEIDRETGYRTRSLLVYPVMRSALRGRGNSKDNRVFAVIEAINKEKESTFTAEDESILGLVGKQAGVLLSNAHFYHQLQNESHKTATLLEVSKEISDVQLDLGKMMEKIMARARQVLTVERASIFLIDEAKKELWSILTDSEMAAKVGGDNVIRLPVGVGIAGTVARTGEMLNIPDAYSSPLFNPAFDRISGYVTKAALCVPIKVSSKGGRVLGVMQFINKINGYPFNQEDEKLAGTFSSFVAISLNNLLLYDELREGQLVRQKNKELVRLRDKAKQAAEAKANFLMSMSHEIRTPMSGVIGMTELLEATELTTEQDEMVSTIRNCGESLLAIINDILDYGRLESGKLELEKACFDLVALAEDTMDVIRSKVEAKCISMKLSVSPSLHTHVVGDSFRLRQVLINLLGNAVKFTPENGEILMRVQPHHQEGTPPDQTCVYFGVTDTGIGIPPEKHASLFLPFHQASAGTTRQYGGSGLGLSICKQLMDVMEGKIGVESKPGKGSCFWITPRFKRMEEEGYNMSVGDKLKTDFRISPELTVLVASSSERQRKVFETFLGVFGITCTHVGSPDELYAALAAGSPCGAFDLVLLDSIGLDGITLDNLKAAVKQVRKLKAPKTTLCILTMMTNKASLSADFQGEATILANPAKHRLLARLLHGISGSVTPPTPLAAVPVPPLSPKRRSSKKLLVAEDNKTNQLLIKRQLAQFSIEPTVCDNGRMVIDKLLEEPHDVILMDCHMPELDGYGASRLIRKMEAEGELKPPRIAIIALTADALPHTRATCLDAGMDDYVTKPLRKQVLKEVLTKWFFDPC